VTSNLAEPTTVVGYLQELEGRLRGPARARAELLAEARDSLHDAVEAHRCAGLDPGAAERRAVADFGALDEVAPGYQTELALVQGRRTAGLLLVLPLLGVVWDLVWSFKPATGGPAPPAAVLFGRLWVGIALSCLAGAGVAVAATGRPLVRGWAPRRIARLTGGAALAAGTAATAWVPVAALAPERAVGDLTTWPPTAVAWVCSAAVTVSLIRSGRRCLAVAQG
jgi:hypothetical protein